MTILFVFIGSGIITAQTEHKLKKDGKYKNKKTKVTDHHSKAEHKKKQHNVDWKHHNQVENQSFSKKKKKKYK